MSNRYLANPDRIQAGVRQLEDITEAAQSMVSEFLDEISATVTWPGTSDEFAEKVRPQEQQERQVTKDTCRAIRDSVTAIADGTMKNVDSMLGTKNQALEDIGKQGNRISEVEAGRGRR